MSKMHTSTGEPAAWPILHTFFQEACNEQHTIAAETTAMARQKLESTEVYWNGALTYVQSKDANNRFVFDNI
jgi:pyruvate-formate lyase-activating enzyme